MEYIYIYIYMVPKLPARKNEEKNGYDTNKY